MVVNSLRFSWYRENAKRHASLLVFLSIKNLRKTSDVRPDLLVNPFTNYMSVTISVLLATSNFVHDNL